jgi:single-strand DNA-binding protein
VNFVNIAGHLGADPEVRFTSTGKKVTTLRVATRSRKGGADVTIWWRVTIWGEQFDKMIPHLKKGSPIVAFGEMQKPEIFNDREGKPQISLEIWASNIQFSPFGKPDREPGSAGAAAGATSSAAPAGQANSAPPINPYMKNPMQPAPVGGETYDDEVPF